MSFGLFNNLFGHGGNILGLGDGMRLPPSGSAINQLNAAIDNVQKEVGGLIKEFTGLIFPGLRGTQNNGSGQSGNYANFGVSSSQGGNYANFGVGSSQDGNIGGAPSATGGGQMTKSDEASAQMQTSFDNAIASASQTLRVSTDGQAALNSLRARPN